MVEAVKKKHDEGEILEAAVKLALEEGISRLTFGRLATRLEISDRIIVYYFTNKDTLISAVLQSFGSRLQTILGDAFGSGATDHVDLLSAAWPVLSDNQNDAIFGLLLEVNGFAAAGREPYATLAPLLIEAWIDWLETFIDGPPDHRRTEATTAVTILDGLLQIRLLGSDQHARTAALRLGISVSDHG